MTNIGLLSHAAAAGAYLLLCTLLLRHWRNPMGASLVVAAGATALWAATVAWGTLADYPPVLLMEYAELARDVSWIVVLLQLLSLRSGEGSGSISGWRWRGVVTAAAVLAAAIIASPLLLASLGLKTPAALYDLKLSLWLLLAVCGLLLVEQLYRNAGPRERWSSKFICLGIGGIFAYDFFMYAEALLFRQLDAELWRARGLVMAVAVPWLAVGLARERRSEVDLHVSRQVVFHSVTLLGAGAYLLCMALIGYYIRFWGGSWGGVLQMGFLAGALALLLSVLVSGRLRANLRVQLNKHFFSYRYDYRDEWLKFTAALATLEDDVPTGIIERIAPLVGASAGLLFIREQEQFSCIAHSNMPMPEAGRMLGEVPRWMEDNGWVVDLLEWRRDSALYSGLEIPGWLREQEDIWLLVPLIFRDRVIGVLVIKRAELKRSLNWEDRDLLKTASRQAATLLAQHLAGAALVEARQFDAFNRLSAYVVHDLKNILAQQSLIVANASRHKDNPQFVDDMISTVTNSVRRMQRLMEQMRSGVRQQPAQQVSINQLLEALIGDRAHALPKPIFTVPDQDAVVLADPERLATVFTHIVQNAQEATADDGVVKIVLDQKDTEIIVSVSDTGCGMDEQFIRDRLFKPFDSTKGLTGMGIGVFESREYLRMIGGDIQVTSIPGDGTTFTLTLPRDDLTSDSVAAQQEPGTETQGIATDASERLDQCN